MMITNPLGVFEPDIAEATQIVHDVEGDVIQGRTSTRLSGENLTHGPDAVHYNTKHSVSLMEEVGRVVDLLDKVASG